MQPTPFMVTLGAFLSIINPNCFLCVMRDNEELYYGYACEIDPTLVTRYVRSILSSSSCNDEFDIIIY